jgi:hypothetical protein
VDNQTADPLIVIYREDGNRRVFEVAPSSAAFVTTVLGGATGAVDILSESCESLARDVDVEEFDTTQIVFAGPGQVTSGKIEQNATSDLPGATELPDDRCS